MAKTKTLFYCTDCGNELPKWQGQCPSCGAWNTIVEQPSTPKSGVKRSARMAGISPSKAQKLSEIQTTEELRFQTGMNELDRVLGGGAVKGSLVLIGGAPGIGKSTLMLQICNELCKKCTVLYASGEESPRQIKLRAQRLGVAGESLYLLSETDLEDVIEAVHQVKPDILIVDSIQTMSIGSTDTTPGSISQVKQCTTALMNLAKSEDVTIFIIGHINKEGSIAGPKVLEHMVDCVLYFEGDQHLAFRILRAGKNRFGATNEIGVFEMQGSGLEEVSNPSEYLLEGRPEHASGCVVACSMEGTRPILVEIQALVCESNFGIPRRTAVGTDFNRVNLLMAVLEKKVGLHLAASDAYVNIAGGMKMTEPAIDLGICLAIASSMKDIVIPDKLMAFGEIGLSGEVRAVSMAGQRVQEAKKLGFDTVILPEVCRNSVEKADGIQLIYVRQIQDAIRYIMNKR